MLVSEKYKSPNFYVSLLVNYGILRKASYLCRKFRHSLYIARLWKKKNITLYRCARIKNCQWALSQGTWFVEGRLLAWFYVCKYRTGSKKVLQTEFRFWSLRKRFSYVTEVADAIYLVILGFFALQRDYFWSAKKPFLDCKTTTIAMQRRLFWSAKVAILKRKGAFFNVLKLHSCIVKRYNSLSTSMIIAARSKLTNFELKISSCVQLAVLSGQECKYRSGLRSA